MELPADAAVRQCHSAGHAHAASDEELFDAIEQGVAICLMVALRFDIDFVHLELVGDDVPVVLEFLRVIKTAYDTGGNINRHVEIPVIVRGAGTAGADGEQDKEESEGLFHLSHHFIISSEVKLVHNFDDRSSLDRY